MATRRAPIEGANQPDGRSRRDLPRRIDHVGVIVRDADQAARRFVGALGLGLDADWVDPSQRFRLVYLECGDTTLQLVQPLGEGPLMEHLRSKGEGLHHVCLEVRHLEDAIEAIGIDADGTPYLGGKGSRVCFLVERPVGVLIELTEPSATGG